MHFRRIRDIILVRLEQVAPFPHDLLIDVVERYSGAEVVWCQEEPKNMGCWSYVKPRYDAAMRARELSREIRYVGRPSQASAATASLAIHLEETKRIVESALTNFTDRLH